MRGEIILFVVCGLHEWELFSKNEQRIGVNESSHNAEDIKTVSNETNMEGGQVDITVNGVFFFIHRYLIR